MTVGRTKLPDPDRDWNWAPDPDRESGSRTSTATATGTSTATGTGTAAGTVTSTATSTGPATATATTTDSRRDHCERLLADCRLRAATELFAHTWDPLVLAALSEGPRRRSALLASGGGMRDKVLTEALRRLRANGLISRRSYAAAPPRVEYALTPLGRSLVDGPLRALGHWAADHGEELLEAQEGAAAV